MRKINNEEMKQINGGSRNWGILAGVGAAVSFFIGIIDGWTNPRKCN